VTRAALWLLFVVAVLVSACMAREVAPLKPTTRPAAKVVSIDVVVRLNCDDGTVREMPAQVHLLPAK
jgi:hypothetical protein